MSKSKGNVIDPLALIDQFGADALRFAICALTGPGRDVKLGRARVESYRSFVTKLWNAARFCEMNAIRPVPGFDPASLRLPLTRWIVDAANAAVREATAALEAYRFDDYAAAIIVSPGTSSATGSWNSPSRRWPRATPRMPPRSAPAAQVFGTILRLLHPVMPFVTEALWDEFGYGEPCSLIRAAWPEPVTVPQAEAARSELDWVVRLITEVRTVRSEMGVPQSVTIAGLWLNEAAPATLARAERWQDAIRRLARASEIAPLTGAVRGARRSRCWTRRRWCCRWPG